MSDVRIYADTAGMIETAVKKYSESAMIWESGGVRMMMII